MQYRVIERRCGPEFRPSDWRSEAGEARAGHDGIRLDASQPPARLVWSACPLGDGGDVTQAFRFAGAPARPGSRLAFHFHRQPSRPGGSGFRVELTPGRIRTCFRDRALDERPMPAGPEPDPTHEIRLATLADSYAVWLDGRPLAGGEAPPPFPENEGWTTVESEGVAARIFHFEHGLIADVAEAPPWQRAQRLYAESFTPESLAQNWIVSRAGADSGLQSAAGGLVLRPMCNAFLRQRFEGPMAMDCRITPSHAPDFTAGVTDAIVLWMADGVTEPLADYLARMDAARSAGLPTLLPLPLYWMDMGGSNNVTTRLRRHPHRRLVRQFTDSARLLARDRSYRVSAVQHGEFAEFWVDGTPRVRFRDRRPLTGGHVGFRAFCAGLRVDELSVWRLAA